MRPSLRLLLPLLILVFAASACMSEPVNILESDADKPGDAYQALTANVPIIAPVETDVPVPVVPIPSATQAPIPKAVVEASALNLRDGPDTSFPILGSLSEGEGLTVLGQYNRCDWLRVQTRTGEIGWVKAGAGFANFPGDCSAVPSGPFRPVNGTLIYDRRVDYGPGTLTVNNVTPSDGLVVLTTLENTPVVGFYIQSMQEYTLSGCPDGEYLLYFTYGQAWDGNKKNFMMVETVKKMDQSIEFVTDETGYTTWTLSLNSLDEGMGTASASDISPDSFPQLP